MAVRQASPPAVTPAHRGDPGVNKGAAPPRLTISDTPAVDDIMCATVIPSPMPGTDPFDRGPLLSRRRVP